MRSTCIVIATVVSTLAVACSDPGQPTQQADHSAVTSSPKKQGRVDLRQESGGTNTFRATAVFSEDVASKPSSCTTVPVGAACSLMRCSADTVAPSNRSDRAGDIAISVTERGMPKNIALAFNPQTSTYAQMIDESTPVAFGGETVTVSSKGGADVPAFKTVLSFPTSLKLTSPVVTDAGCSFPSTHADMNLAWNGGGGTDIVQVVFSSGPGSDATLNCSFDAESGGRRGSVCGRSRVHQGSWRVLGFDIRQEHGRRR
jgi:hypothetical protein